MQCASVDRRNSRTKGERTMIELPGIALAILITLWCLVLNDKLNDIQESLDNLTKQLCAEEIEK